MYRQRNRFSCSPEPGEIIPEAHGASVVGICVVSGRQASRHLERRHWSGSDTGGERAAAIYSLIGTANLNALDPEGYLRHVLTHNADHPINRILESLPWNLPLVNGSLPCERS